MTNPLEGREVITREPAYLTTAFGKKLPKPRLVSGVNECLLSDGATVFECEGSDFVHEDVQRVIRHRSKHAPSARKYPAETVAKVLKYRELERAKSIRGWSERVAIRLNKDKVPRPDGGQWLAHNVHSVASNHQAEHEAQEQKAVIHALNDATGRMTGRERAITIATNLTHARKLLDEVLSMEASFNYCDHDDYDDLRVKAAMLDQMRTFMGEGK